MIFNMIKKESCMFLKFSLYKLVGKKILSLNEIRLCSVIKYFENNIMF